MEMDFMGPRPVLQPRRGDGGGGDDQPQQPCPPWRLAAPTPMMMMTPPPARPNPDAMPPAATYHHQIHHWKQQQQHPSFDQVATRVPPPSPPQPGRSVTAPAPSFRCAIPPASYHATAAALRSMGEANPFRVPNCSPPPDPAAQLTMFYAGSVRVFDNVSREKAEQIMFMAAKAAAQAAVGGGGGPPVRRLPPRRSEPADRSRSSSRQAASLARACSDPVLLTPHAALGFGDHASQQDLFLPRDVPLARSASLARFLERRKQRAANAAAGPYSRRDISPGSNSMDTFTAVSPANTAPELSWFLGDGTGMNGYEEAPDTELKM